MTLVLYQKFAFKKLHLQAVASGCAESGGASTDSAFVADSASSWFARGEFGHVNVAEKFVDDTNM